MTVCFGGKEYSAVAENGAFAVVCPPQSGSFEPVAFTVRDGSGETLKFTAFFGDVFLCAGQSNMEYCIEGLDDRDDVLAACAEAKGIYFLNTYGTLSDGVALVRSATPLADFVGEVRWQPIFDESAKYLSAVAAIVALKLIKRADAPIGLVCNPVGGVQICAYLPQSLIESDEDLKNDLTARNFYSADGFNAYGADNYTQPCGLYNERIAPLFEMMADTGVNAIEPLDPLGGVSVADAKKRVGDRVCLKGGVNTLTFMNGTTEDVERETRAVLEQGMAGGGFLLGSGDDFPRESKPENIKTFVETAHKYGKYPVKK